MSPCTVLSATELPPWENWGRAWLLENLLERGRSGWGGRFGERVRAEQKGPGSTGPGRAVQGSFMWE